MPLAITQTSHQGLKGVCVSSCSRISASLGFSTPAKGTAVGMLTPSCRASNCLRSSACTAPALRPGRSTPRAVELDPRASSAEPRGRAGRRIARNGRNAKVLTGLIAPNGTGHPAGHRHPGTGRLDSRLDSRTSAYAYSVRLRPTDRICTAVQTVSTRYSHRCTCGRATLRAPRRKP